MYADLSKNLAAHRGENQIGLATPQIGIATPEPNSCWVYSNAGFSGGE